MFFCLNIQNYFVLYAFVNNWYFLSDWFRQGSGSVSKTPRSCLPTLSKLYSQCQAGAWAAGRSTEGEFHGSSEWIVRIYKFYKPRRFKGFKWELCISPVIDSKTISFRKTVADLLNDLRSSCDYDYGERNISQSSDLVQTFNGPSQIHLQSFKSSRCTCRTDAYNWDIHMHLGRVCNGGRKVRQQYRLVMVLQSTKLSYKAKLS